MRGWCSCSVQNKLLVENGPARDGCTICESHDANTWVSGTTYRSRTSAHSQDSFFAVLPRKVGFDERRSWVLGRTLGKLDRLYRDDQQAAPRSGTHHLRKTSHARVFRASRPSRGLMDSSGGTWNFPHGRNLLKAHSHKRTNLWTRASRDMVGRRRLTCVLRRNILRKGCGPLSTTLTEPCRDPNEGSSLQHPSCPCLQTDFPSSTHSRSGCSSDAPAGVTANSTHLATTAWDAETWFPSGKGSSTSVP